MLRRRSESSFPVPLWASLLLALLALTQPLTVRALESFGGRIVALPLRAVFALAPRTVLGAERDELRRAPARAALWEFNRRVDVAARRRPAGIALELVPHPVRIVERRGSSHGQADELVLDQRRDDLRDCVDYVTVGDALVGFLAVDGVTDDRELAGLARVELLAHVARGRLPRRVPARIDMQDGAPLAFLVEPSSPVDRWPLRCALLDDPYRAARLVSGEYQVHTSGLREDPLGMLPEGLTLGWLRIFGYRDLSGRVLPIGFEVEPRVSTESIDVVTLWCAAERDSNASRAVAGVGVRVQLLRLPVPSAGRERYLATPTGAAASFRPGAAVLDGARLVGVCEEGGPGYAIVAPFGQPGRSWSLVFVPDDPEQDPIPFVAKGLGPVDDQLVLHPLGAPVLHGRGAVHVSCGSRDFPAGAFVGAAVVGEDGDLRIERSSPQTASVLTVYLHEGVTGGGR